MAPYFSIVIPAYNEENYIRPTLHSIQQQSFQDFETIVVANGCTDKTEEIVKKRVDEKLRLLSLPKANVSVARNAGALNAQGKVLLFLDADTQLAENGLQRMKELFREGCAVATTKGKPDVPKLKYVLASALKNIYLSMKLYQGCSGALLCRKEHFQQTGGYDPEIMVREHRKLILKLKDLGKYRCLDTSVTTSMRRFQQWGVGKIMVFWTKKWFQDHFASLKGKEYEKVR